MTEDIKPELRLAKHQDGTYTVGMYQEVDGIETYIPIGDGLTKDDLDTWIIGFQHSVRHLSNSSVLAASTVLPFEWAKQ